VVNLFLPTNFGWLLDAFNILSITLSRVGAFDCKTGGNGYVSLLSRY
jgi:hypothetical protein